MPELSVVIPAYRRADPVSQEARPYALITLLAALSWQFFLRAPRCRGRGDFVLWPRPRP